MDKDTKENKGTNENSKNEWQEREIGALWKREGKNQRYLSGKLKIGEFGVEKTVNVVVFINKYKEKDNQPDFRVYEDRPREESTESSSQKKAEAKPKDLDSSLPSVLQ